MRAPKGDDDGAMDVDEEQPRHRHATGHAAPPGAQPNGRPGAAPRREEPPAEDTTMEEDGNEEAAAEEDEAEGQLAGDAMDVPVTVAMPTGSNYSAAAAVDMIMANLRKCDRDGFFFHPVTEAVAPNYFSVIKRPMSLSVIKEKVRLFRLYYPPCWVSASPLV